MADQAEQHADLLAAQTCNCGCHVGAIKHAAPCSCQRPKIPDAATRIFAFAQALGLTIADLVVLLESYDLCLLDGKAGPRYPGVLRLNDGSQRGDGG